MKRKFYSIFQICLQLHTFRLFDYTTLFRTEIQSILSKIQTGQVLVTSKTKKVSFELVGYWTHKHAREKAHKLVCPSSSSNEHAPEFQLIPRFSYYTHAESDRSPFVYVLVKS